ncbi:uncharacterized protein LOC111820450 isoform X1 [Trichechus manatus latirostris]|uniref:Uncharacterized protein LOC111820450 isoform X1 n=1 Tax=Trichechus manatus latirostris TaxID=127582 RepID=A0A2Y9QZ91_TRIMA|nr:uncharacterized protein LOC111820450 isoform X1 [Trichechus manatus latirostris]
MGDTWKPYATSVPLFWWKAWISSPCTSVLWMTEENCTNFPRMGLFLRWCSLSQYDMDLLMLTFGDIPLHAPVLLAWTVLRHTLNPEETSNIVRKIGGKAIQLSVFQYLTRLLRSLASGGNDLSPTLLALHHQHRVHVCLWTPFLRSDLAGAAHSGQSAGRQLPWIKGNARTLPRKTWATLSTDSQREDSRAVHWIEALPPELFQYWKLRACILATRCCSHCPCIWAS